MLPIPLVPIDATGTGHESQLCAVHFLATHMYTGLSTSLAAPESGRIPIVAPVPCCHLLICLASRPAVSVGSHQGEQGEENDGED